MPVGDNDFAIPATFAGSAISRYRSWLCAIAASNSGDFHCVVSRRRWTDPNRYTVPADPRTTHNAGAADAGRIPQRNNAATNSIINLSNFIRHASYRKAIWRVGCVRGPRFLRIAGRWRRGYNVGNDCCNAADGSAAAFSRSGTTCGKVFGAAASARRYASNSESPAEVGTSGATPTPSQFVFV